MEGDWKVQTLVLLIPCSDPDWLQLHILRCRLQALLRCRRSALAYSHQKPPSVSEKQHSDWIDQLIPSTQSQWNVAQLSQKQTVRWDWTRIRLRITLNLTTQRSRASHCELDTRPVLEIRIMRRGASGALYLDRIQVSSWNGQLSSLGQTHDCTG